MASADLIIEHGDVLGLAGPGAAPQAVAIGAGRIVALGEAVEEWRAARTRVIDARGATVMAGIIDSHNHVRLGSSSRAVSLFGADSLEEILARLAHHVAATPGGDWIEGDGWNYSALPDGRPHASMIDGVCAGRPAWLFSYDAHTVWLNRAAIERLGIRAASPHLPFGDAEVLEGELTGWVHDFAVRGIHPVGQAYLERFLPSYSLDAQYERLVASLRDAARFGITTVVEPQNGLGDLALFERAHREGELTSRLIAAIIHTPDDGRDALDEIAERVASYRHDRIALGPVKLYIDDVIEPHSAAMLAPYANAPGRGDTFWAPEDFAELVVALEERRLQAFVHATGDRGIRTALDAFAAARRRHGPLDTRHQVVHVECLDAADVGRFASLGVVACMQPRHCAPDITGEWRANVGPERERYAWAMRSLIDSGACVAFSSDWNVAEMDPMIGLYSACTRADLQGRDAWNELETVSLDQALHAYGPAGAWANFVDHERGDLRVGRQADVVVLDGNLRNREPAQWLTTRVTHTIVDGEVVYEAD